jgi:hypothetical protein
VFRSWDFLLNLEQDQNITLFVDDTPPATNLTVDQPRYRAAATDPWNVSDVTPIDLPAVDGGAVSVGLANTTYRLDDGPWVPFNGSVSRAGLADGMYQVMIQSTDLLGNAEVTWSAPIQLDTTPPRTVGRYIPREFAGLVYDLVAPDALWGVASTWYSINGGDFAVYSGPLAFITPGTYVVQFWSIDHLGNSEPVRSTTIVVPNWKPVVALVFAVFIAITGVIVVRRLRPELEAPAARVWARLVLPWVVVESITGVASLFFAVLMIPPLLGVGLIVDLAILALGLLLPYLVALRRRRITAPAQEEPPPTASTSELPADGPGPKGPPLP